MAASLEKILANFFWEGYGGSKINHLVNWCKFTGLDGRKVHHTALLAKWCWRFSKEETTLWRQIVRSIHGKRGIQLVYTGKVWNSLRSPWVSISRVWRSMKSLTLFKLGNGCRIGFWTDSLVVVIPLKDQFSKLYEIALLLNSSAAAHWDNETFSWSLSFRRCLKEEIAEFRSLLYLLSSEKVIDSDDYGYWSIDHRGHYTV